VAVHELTLSIGGVKQENKSICIMEEFYTIAPGYLVGLIYSYSKHLLKLLLPKEVSPVRVYMLFPLALLNTLWVCLLKTHKMMCLCVIIVPLTVSMIMFSTNIRSHFMTYECRKPGYLNGPQALLLLL